MPSKSGQGLRTDSSADTRLLLGETPGIQGMAEQTHYCENEPSSYTSRVSWEMEFCQARFCVVGRGKSLMNAFSDHIRVLKENKGTFFTQCTYFYMKLIPRLFCCYCRLARPFLVVTGIFEQNVWVVSQEEFCCSVTPVYMAPWSMRHLLSSCSGAGSASRSPDWAQAGFRWRWATWVPSLCTFLPCSMRGVSGGPQPAVRRKKW